MDSSTQTQTHDLRALFSEAKSPDTHCMMSTIVHHESQFGICQNLPR